MKGVYKGLLSRRCSGTETARPPGAELGDEWLVDPPSGELDVSLYESSDDLTVHRNVAGLGLPERCGHALQAVIRL